MATAAPPRPTTNTVRSPTATRRPGWGPAQWLALLALPLIVYEAWTLIGWLAAGPHEVTAYRQTGSASYIWAWVIQIFFILGVSTLVMLLVRDCRRQRRLTFD